MEWIEHTVDSVPPCFWPDEKVRVEYRDGRQAEGANPWEFQGWNHIGNDGDWPNDIVRYAFLTKMVNGKLIKQS